MGEAKRKANLSVVSDEERWPRAVELTVSDRLWLFNLLPREGNIATVRLIRELREAFEFTPDEVKAFDVTYEGTVVTWNKKKEKSKVVELGPEKWKLIVKTLIAVSQKEKLDRDCVSLYDKFVKG